MEGPQDSIGLSAIPVITVKGRVFLKCPDIIHGAVNVLDGVLAAPAQIALGIQNSVRASSSDFAAFSIS
jgi:hypothetical protein